MSWVELIEPIKRGKWKTDQYVYGHRKYCKGEKEIDHEMSNKICILTSTHNTEQIEQIKVNSIRQIVAKWSCDWDWRARVSQSQVQNWPIGKHTHNRTTTVQTKGYALAMATSEYNHCWMDPLEWPIASTNLITILLPLQSIYMQMIGSTSSTSRTLSLAAVR